MATLNARLQALEAAHAPPLLPLPALVIHPGQDAQAERAAYIAAHCRAPEFTIEVLLVPPQRTDD